MTSDAIIWTEGKTDWQHLKRAFEMLPSTSCFTFNETADDWGDDRLLKQCAALALVEQSHPTIFVFDRDNENILPKIEDATQGHKVWGNNVFSLALPVPPHRASEHSICIEQYYTDDDLRRVDPDGRRLFFSTEFDVTSGRHKTNRSLSIGNKAKLAGGRPRYRLGRL